MRNLTPEPLASAKSIRALAPYLIAQLIVLATVLAFSQILWREGSGPAGLPTNTSAPGVDARELLNRQPNQNQNQDADERKPVAKGR